MDLSVKIPRPPTADVCLSKAIRWAIVTSLVVHSIVLLQKSSITSGRWLETISMEQYWLDTPMLIISHNHTLENSTLAIQTTTLPTTLESMTTKSSSFSSSSSSTTDVRAPTTSPRIPLHELVNSNPNVTCNPGKSGKSIIADTILSENITHPTQRRIPKIVHVTSFTRCMTPPFLKNLDQWRLPGHSFYFHDEWAVDRLLAKYWPEFPQLQLMQKCTVSGAAKADIWRLLVLWEYGGIYTDIDNAPGPKFLNGSVIEDDDDSWFVVERLGIMSQYFMAASPRHPFIHIALIHLFERLLQVDNIRKQYVPFVTGPGTIKSAMMIFRNDKVNEKVERGKYYGWEGRSITVEGAKGQSNDYVIRESVNGVHKKGGYTAMGMNHFSNTQKSAPTDSCYEHLYKQTKNLVMTTTTTTTYTTENAEQSPDAESHVF